MLPEPTLWDEAQVPSLCACVILHSPYTALVFDMSIRVYLPPLNSEQGLGYLTLTLIFLELAS